MSEALNPKIVDALKKLSTQEQDLLVRVLKVERDKLYQEKPRVKEDLLKAVREVYK
jgi:hypothetical protein